MTSTWTARSLRADPSKLKIIREPRTAGEAVRGFYLLSNMPLSASGRAAFLSERRKCHQNVKSM